MPLGNTTPERVLNMPSLPEPGPIRLIAISGSIAILAWLIVTVVLGRTKRRNEALWSALLLVFVGLTMAAGRFDAAWHTVMQVTTVGIAGRNAIRLQGRLRWLTVIGIIAWITSAGIAIRHFG